MTPASVEREHLEPRKRLARGVVRRPVQGRRVPRRGAELDECRQSQLTGLELELPSADGLRLCEVKVCELPVRLASEERRAPRRRSRAQRRLGAAAMPTRRSSRSASTASGSTERRSAAASFAITEADPGARFGSRRRRSIEVRACRDRAADAGGDPPRRRPRSHRPRPNDRGWQAGIEDSPLLRASQLERPPATVTSREPRTRYSM